MKLLFDQNLSPQLGYLLADLYPASAHVINIGLGVNPADIVIWKYARSNGYIIVTKDGDFGKLVASLTRQPKVVLIKRGNCPTEAVETILRLNYERIEVLSNDTKFNLLTLT